MSPTTLGLLISRLDDAFSRSLAFAFRDELLERGLRGVCFAGHELLEGRADPRNLAYELATERAVDGLIIGTLGAGLTSEVEAQFLRRYQQLPLCSYSVRLPNAPLVSVDHAAGMRSAVRHLMQVHGHRRIAFISGPAGNLDASLRYEGYCSALAGSGVKVEPALVAPGDFSMASAVEAIRILLDDRRLGFDALVAANDEMALGAMSALTARGIRVPRDVAVVGFDDAADSRFASPPLSTVRHPWRAQVTLAVDLLLAQLAGKRMTDCLAVAADFVPRSSCGCHHAADVQRTARDSLMPPMVDENDWLSGWAFALRRNLGGRNIQLAQEVAGQLVVHFWMAATASAEEFLPLLERTLADGLEQAASLAGWYAGLGQLRDSVLARLSDRPNLADKVHELTHVAFQAVSYATERQQALRRIAVEREGGCLALAGERTINAFEPEAVTLGLREPLEQMGLGACFVARFEEPQGSDAKRAQLVVLCDTSSPYAKPLADVFDAKLLLPEDVWPKRPGCVMVLEMLPLGQEVLGYALLELGPRQGALYPGLAQRLAAALKGAELAKETSRQARRLRQLELHRMQGELYIERQVQRWILPGKSRLGNLEVVAGLSSGNDRSAAYYDVLRSDRATWLCAGTVRGASGNSRLMVPVVQAVVASLCAQPGAPTVQSVRAQIHSVLRDKSRPQGRAIDSLQVVLVRWEASGAVTVAGDFPGVYALRRGARPKVMGESRSEPPEFSEALEALFIVTRALERPSELSWLAHLSAHLSSGSLQAALEQWRTGVGPEPDLGLMVVHRVNGSEPSREPG